MKKTMNNKIDDDDEEFQILLSREDYNEMKANQVRLKKVEGQYQEKMALWQREKKDLIGQLTIMGQEKKDLETQCQSVKVTAQNQYSQFLQTISQLRTLCGLSIIKQQGLRSQIQQLNKMTNQKNNKNSAKLSLCLIQKTLSYMTQLLLTTLSPIQALISGHKLTNQALNEENHKCQRQLEKLNKHFQQLQLQKSTLTKQHQFQLSQLKNDLIQQHAIIVKNLETQISQLRQHNTQLIAKLSKAQTSKIRIQKEGDLLSQQNHQLHQQIKQLQQENKQYQQHIKILKQSIQIQSRSKNNRYQQKHQGQSKNMIKNYNNGESSPTKKFQQESFIKETLIQYSRQIKNNLIAIGNLSQDQIKEIGVSQLKTLIKFIHQLEDDFQ